MMNWGPSSFTLSPLRRRLLACFSITTILLVSLKWSSDLYYDSLDTFKSSPDHCSRSPPGAWTPHDALLKWASSPRDPREVLQMGMLWNGLVDLFQSHPPHPAHQIRPVFIRPPASKLVEYTADTADSDLHLSNDDARATRQAHHDVLDRLPDYDTVASSYSGRGIVILAGGRYSSFAATSISVLRQHGSDLPIEVWIKDPSEGNNLWTEELHGQGVTVRDLSEYAVVGSLSSWFNPFAWFSKPVPWSAYQLKIMALLFSSFEEVLFLDADCVPIRDPNHLFETSTYTETGAVIWPDLWPSIASRWLPYLVGLTDEKSELLWNEQSAEAGQMLLSKKRHWKALLLACYYNYHGPGFWYTATIGSGQGWGDKDTYLTALQAVREPFAMIPYKPHRLVAYNTSTPILNLQLGPDGGSAVPFFAHASGGIKWSLDDFREAYSLSNPWYRITGIFNPRHGLLHNLLQTESPILATDSRWGHLQLERQLWKAYEQTACWSRALGSRSLCAWTRDRIKRRPERGQVETSSVHDCNVGGL